MYGLNFLFVKIDLLISIQNEDTQTNNNESTMNQQTIGCNLCYKAGCSENIYSSHWTIYCPSLLTQPCKFCKEEGHSHYFCDKIMEYLQKTPITNQSANCPIQTYEGCGFCKEKGHTHVYCPRIKILQQITKIDS